MATYTMPPLPTHRWVTETTSRVTDAVNMLLTLTPDQAEAELSEINAFYAQIEGLSGFSHLGEQENDEMKLLFGSIIGVYYAAAKNNVRAVDAATVKAVIATYLRYGSTRNVTVPSSAGGIITALAKTPIAQKLGVVVGSNGKVDMAGSIINIANGVLTSGLDWLTGGKKQQGAPRPELSTDYSSAEGHIIPVPVYATEEECEPEPAYSSENFGCGYGSQNDFDDEGNLIPQPSLSTDYEFWTPHVYSEEFPDLSDHNAYAGVEGDGYHANQGYEDWMAQENLLNEGATDYSFNEEEQTYFGSDFDYYTEYDCCR